MQKCKACRMAGNTKAKKKPKERKRWGKKYADKRDWSKYNEELVVRGEFYLAYSWIESWEKELEEMNMGKVGAKYEFPESFIEFLAVLHQWLDCRALEGVARKLAEFGKIPKHASYSAISRRINKVKTSFKLPQSGSCQASCDGTGMKFGNAGQYKARMYGGKREKYIKATITANPKTGDLYACTVSPEGEGKSEPETAERDMKYLIMHGITVQKFYGDGAFDALDLFAFLEKNKIESAIKIRKTAVLKGDNSLRDKELLLYKKKGYRKWAKEKEYGRRWVGTEGIFSAVKRKFGEQTRSKKLVNALNEVERKFWAYERMKQYAKARA